MESVKTTQATTTLEINCNCPYCNKWLDITDRAKGSLDEELRAENIDLEITCKYCKKMFYVERIEY